MRRLRLLASHLLDRPSSAALAAAPQAGGGAEPAADEPVRGAADRLAERLAVDQLAYPQMSAAEKFRYDTQGFITIPGILSRRR